MTSDCFTTCGNESTCVEMMMPFGTNDTIEQVCQSGNKLTIDTNEKPRKAESCDSFIWQQCNLISYVHTFKSYFSYFIQEKMHSNTTSGFLNRFKRILMDNKNKYQGNESDSEVTNQCPQLSLNV